MANQHLNCEQLLHDTAEEYKRLSGVLDALLRGEATAEEVNTTADSVFNRVDGLIDDYQTKRKEPTK